MNEGFTQQNTHRDPWQQASSSSASSDRDLRFAFQEGFADDIRDFSWALYALETMYQPGAS